VTYHCFVLVTIGATCASLTGSGVGCVSRRDMSEWSTSGKTRRGQRTHHRATLRFFGLFQQKEYCRASHSPHSDSLDAKLGHIVGVGDMVEQRITLSRRLPHNILYVVGESKLANLLVNLTIVSYTILDQHIRYTYGQ
jgi:hypothetical protein